MELLPRFVRASQQAQARVGGGIGDDAEEEEDDEIAKGMVRLFAEVGEAYVALIATGARTWSHMPITCSVLAEEPELSAGHLGVYRCRGLHGRHHRTWSGSSSQVLK